MEKEKRLWKTMDCRNSIFNDKETCGEYVSAVKF
jgi:hypothetical protein